VKKFFKSWRTTVAGIATLACAAAPLAGIHIPPEVPAALAALGLMAARDNKVTSEQAGAKP
jgi:hypothetical protein